MQNLSAISKFLATLFLIVMIWGSYFLISIVFQEHSNENNDYIPENATFVGRINGRKILKASIATIILHEDEEILDLIKETFKDEHGPEFKRIGVELNSDIIIFNQSENGHELMGVLLNLNSERIFKKNIHSFLSKNEVSASNGDVGLVYFETSDPSVIPLSKKNLQKKATTILSKKSAFDMTMLISDLDNSVIQTWSKDGLFGGINVAHNTKLSFHIFEDELIIDGDLALNTDSKSELKKELAPKGLHIDSDQIATLVQDKISLLISSLNIEEAKLTGFSINYHGLEVITEPTLNGVPKFDALLSFENDFIIEKNIDSLLNWEQFTRVDAKSFTYCGVKFYIDQIDSKTIRIGNSKEVSLIEADKKNSFRISGDPTRITEVAGEGGIVLMLHAIPAYVTSKKFLARIENLDVQIDTPKNGKSKVHAVIKFKKEQYALNALIELLIHAEQFSEIGGYIF